MDQKKCLTWQNPALINDVQGMSLINKDSCDVKNDGPPNLIKDYTDSDCVGVMVYST